MTTKSCEAGGLLFRLRLVLGLFMLGLALSGVTAFPLQRELEALTSALGLSGATASAVHSGLDGWLIHVRDGLRDVYSHYPWMAYGTDWLAFAHLILGVFFVGPFVNPVRNIWVLWAGLIACVLVLPLALICGPIRHVPFGWRLIDCSFGVFGALPLVYCLVLTKRLDRLSAA